MKQFLLSLVFIFTFALGATAQSRTDAGASGPALRFFPNPATTNITFEFNRPTEGGYTLQLFHFLGRRLYEGKNLTGRTVVNLADYTRGVYVYKLWNNRGQLVESGKFQVSK